MGIVNLLKGKKRSQTTSSVKTVNELVGDRSNEYEQERYESNILLTKLHGETASNIDQQENPDSTTQSSENNDEKLAGLECIDFPEEKAKISDMRQETKDNDIKTKVEVNYVSTTVSESDKARIEVVLEPFGGAVPVLITDLYPKYDVDRIINNAKYFFECEGSENPSFIKFIGYVNSNRVSEEQASTTEEILIKQTETEEEYVSENEIENDDMDIKGDDQPLLLDNNLNTLPVLNAEDENQKGIEPENPNEDSTEPLQEYMEATVSENIETTNENQNKESEQVKSDIKAEEIDNPIYAEDQKLLTKKSQVAISETKNSIKDTREALKMDNSGIANENINLDEFEKIHTLNRVDLATYLLKMKGKEECNIIYCSHYKVCTYSKEKKAADCDDCLRGMLDFFNRKDNDIPVNFMVKNQSTMVSEDKKEIIMLEE